LVLKDNTIGSQTRRVCFQLDADARTKTASRAGGEQKDCFVRVFYRWISDSNRMPHPRRAEHSGSPAVFVAASTEVPSTIDYKDQQYTLEELQARQGNEVPSTIDYKDQQYSLEEIQVRQRNEVTSTIEYKDQQYTLDELRARQRNEAPSNLDSKDQHHTLEEFRDRQRQHTLYSVVAEAVPLWSDNIPIDVENDIHPYSENSSLPPNQEAPTQSKEPRDGNSSACTASSSRKRIYFIVIPVAIVLVTGVIVVASLLATGSSSKSDEAVSVVPTPMPSTAAPTTFQSTADSSNFSIETFAPIDGSVTCLGVPVPVWDPMPPFSDTGACQALRLMVLEDESFSQSRTINVTCSCVKTETGAIATCREDCWTCFPLRKLCYLKTEIYEWTNAQSFISEAKIMVDYQCGRDDRISWTLDYDDPSFPCTMTLNGEECSSCSTVISEDKTCVVYNCTNFDFGGEFNTCTGEYDFYGDSPFYEVLASEATGDGGVPFLDIFLACPGDIPFPIDE